MFGILHKYLLKINRIRTEQGNVTETLKKSRILYIMLYILYIIHYMLYIILYYICYIIICSQISCKVQKISIFIQVTISQTKKRSIT